MLKTSGSTAKLNDPPLLQKKWSTGVKGDDVTLLPLIPPFHEVTALKPT